MDRIKLGETLGLGEQLIPGGRRNRPGTSIAPSGLVVHSPQSTGQNADAAAHSRFLRSNGYRDGRAGAQWLSWHFSVDEHEAIKQLPISEAAYDASEADPSSIHIRLCNAAGADLSGATARAARLAAALLYDLDLPADAIRQGSNATRASSSAVPPWWEGFTSEVASIRGTLTGPRGGLDFAADEILAGRRLTDLETGSHDEAGPAADQLWTETFELDALRSGADRVTEARRLVKAGGVYPQGCSQFMCAVLDVSPWENANALMGAAPTSLGITPPYQGLQPGDVVGWKEPGASGHVALYLGPSDTEMFADVRAPGAVPRIKNGYYGREIFKSSRF